MNDAKKMRSKHTGLRFTPNANVGSKGLLVLDGNFILLKVSKPCINPIAMTPFEEKEVIRSFREGSEFAFVSLYNRYKGPVYSFCVKMLLDRDQAKDVLQETFLRVYENRHRLIKSDAFRSWVFTIARNQCLNQIRRNSKHLSIDRTEGMFEAMIAKDTPFSALEKIEKVRRVNRFLMHLKPEYREVLVLREYQNMSYEEIAAVTDATLSSVKSRLFKARRKLGTYLAPFNEEMNSNGESTESKEVKTKSA